MPTPSKSTVTDRCLRRRADVVSAPGKRVSSVLLGQTKRKPRPSVSALLVGWGWRRELLAHAPMERTMEYAGAPTSVEGAAGASVA